MIISVLKRIDQMSGTFTRSEAKVADYIKVHYKKVPEMTIKQLAKAAETSEAAVIRFLKAVNIESYGSLKMYLYNEKEILDSDNLLNDIKGGDSSEEIYKKIAIMSKKSIDDTVAYMDFKELDKSVEIIRSAKKILICGVGASAAVGKDLYLKLLRINLPVHFSMDVHVQMTSAIHLNEDACVIIISTSGKTREMLKVAEMCKENGAKTIAITQFGKTPLTSICDINLYVATSETSKRIGTMSARIAELTLLDTLFTCLTLEGVDEYNDYIKRTGEIMDQMKFE